MAVEFDTAQVLTALSLVIGSVGTILVALKGKRESDSNENDEKAIAVSDIKNTTDRVDILWEHIIDLREELSVLKQEKVDLENKYDELEASLEKEKSDHIETRRLLDEALAAIAEKDKQIKDLEEKLNGSRTIK